MVNGEDVSKSFSSTNSEKVGELKIIMESLLGVLVTHRAYILYVAIWQRFVVIRDREMN